MVLGAWLCAGCQSEILIPAYAHSIGRSSYPTWRLPETAEPPHPPPSAVTPPGDAKPETPSSAATGDEPPPAVPSSSGAPATGQAPSGQASSGGVESSAGAAAAGPVLQPKDPKLAKKGCPAATKPAFTDEARKAKSEGLITARCIVETDGSLTCTATWSSAPLMTQPVLDDLAKQKVQPFTLTDGSKARVECSYSFRYKL